MENLKVENARAGAEVRIEDVTRDFGGTIALRDVSLRFDARSWTSIVGPSGSGKSTLLHLIGATDRPTAGRVRVDGQDVSALTRGEQVRFRRERVGMVFQRQILVPYLSALENVMLAQYFHSVADEAEAVEMLRAVGLGDRLQHRPAELSGGQAQRVCIARALINQPALLLLDEPTGNLDRANADLAMDVIENFHRLRGMTIVCATHDPLVARRGGRAVTLGDGRVVADTSLEVPIESGTDSPGRERTPNEVSG